MSAVSDDVHRTYRSTSLLVLGAVGLVLVVGLSLWVLVDELRRSHWLAAGAALLWGVVLAELVGEVFLRPRVTTTPQGVVLVNPVRTVLVPWEEVRGVETELALQIVVDGGRHSSFAATGNRRGSARGRGGVGARPAAGQNPARDALVKAGIAAGVITPPVECKLFIDAGLTQWRGRTGRAAGSASEGQAGLGRPDGEAPARVEWHRPWILAFAVSAVLLVAVSVALKLGA